MRLKTLRLKNFRGYKEPIDIPISNLTTFVGKNDAGKSTILEALEIFFNNEVVSIDNDDLCKAADDEIIEIACVFDDLPENIVVDSSKSTTFNNEYLLNKDNDLEIVKQFKIGASKPKESIYIRCNHPSVENYKDLLSLKNNDLKRRAKSLDIDEELYNASINSEIRHSIWGNISVEELQLSETLLPVDKESSKEIYGQIQKYLPTYALFQSDRPSRDDDPEVTDPMKLAIASALKAVEDELDTIKEQVQIAACETAKRTLEKLKEMSPEIADSLIPEFKSEPKYDSIFKLTIKSDDNIPINKRGSGVRRLILLNFFRAEAERRLKEESKDAIIYAFEEPETSQHPSHQQLLLSAFKELATSNTCQVLFTTHTPSLAAAVPLEGLRFISEENGRKVIESSGDEMLEKICQELGILPEPIPHGAKAIVLVEGKEDITFVKHMSKELSNAGYLSKDLIDAKIALMPIFGCDNLKHWRSKKLIEQFELPWGILLDSDTGATQETKNKAHVQSLKNSGIKAFCTRKREIENYIDTAVIDDYDGEEFNDTIDAKEAIIKQVKVKKTEIIERYWTKMTVEQIRKAEMYLDDNGEKHYEFTEMFEEFLTLVK